MMQFVPAKQDIFCFFSFDYKHAIYQHIYIKLHVSVFTEKSHKPIPHRLQVCTHLATESRDSAAVLRQRLRNTKINHRNYDRNSGLHSPAHQMQSYSTPIAGRLCRAVKSGSGFYVNHQNLSGLFNVYL
jgi:hypothetical protein